MSTPFESVSYTHLQRIPQPDLKTLLVVGQDGLSRGELTEIGRRSMPQVLLLVGRAFFIDPESDGPVVVAVSCGDVKDILAVPDE